MEALEVLEEEDFPMAVPEDSLWVEDSVNLMEELVEELQWHPRTLEADAIATTSRRSRML